MFLLYINELGSDYKGQKQYEFIFGNNKNVLMEEWFFIPSSGRSVPPDIKNIKLVGLLKNSDLVLELVQNSDFFGLIDAVDGIVALGWEPFDQEAEERPDRVCFYFGEEFSMVVKKLSSKNINLITEEIKYNFQ